MDMVEGCTFSHSGCFVTIELEWIPSPKSTGDCASVALLERHRGLNREWPSAVDIIDTTEVVP